MGYRGHPMTIALINDCASSLAGVRVGETWARHWLEKNPDLKVRMDQSAMRLTIAQALLLG